MKKIFLILAVIMLFFVNAAYSVEYFIDGFVFAADGTSGTALTENSFATMHAYRTGINNQIGTLDPPGRVNPLAGSGQAAFYVVDIGSSFWAATAAAEGQTITAVFEVYDPLFGWAGPSYIACTTAIITADEAINLQTDLSPVQLKAIPTPQIVSLDTNQAVLSLTGINENFITSYNLYRSTTLTGTYTLVTTVPQDMGNTIQYTDSGILSGTDYYYKWGVNFNWGGGNGAPLYYTSTANSPARGPVTAPTATQTGTETSTITSTATQTITETNTETSTSSVSVTPTFTGTNTVISTGTFTTTYTATETVTYTFTTTATLTQTNTYTPTFSQTITQTITPTNTATVLNTATSTAISTVVNTATATPVPTPPVLQEPITFPQPANNTITFAYRLSVPASVQIFVYNMMGSEVAIFNQAASASGINTSVCNVSKFPPGIYFYIIKVPETGEKFKVNKFMIER